MRVVLDTNILVSGFLWSGAPQRVIRLATKGQIDLWASSAIMQEFEQVLGYARLQRRMRSLDVTHDDLLAMARAIFTLTEPTGVEPVIIADPTLAALLHTARRGSSRHRHPNGDCSRFRPNYFHGLAFGVVIRSSALFLPHSDLEMLVDTTNSSKAICQWVVLASAEQSQALGVHTWLETRLSPIYRRILCALTDSGFVCTSTVRLATPALRSLFVFSNLFSINRLLGVPGSYPQFENWF